MGKVVVLISADAEWRAVCQLIPFAKTYQTPYGSWFSAQLSPNSSDAMIIRPFDAENPLGHQLIFFHGGWGKISAAGSTQYALDIWKPVLLINLGTCGGIQGQIEPGEILLIDRTIVYDIVEQMGDYSEHIDHYSTRIDLSWLAEKEPFKYQRCLLVSADRDLLAEDIPLLMERYNAVAADWESGAIAWVAMRNQLRLLILRGVTDLVGPGGGDAYGNIELFIEATGKIMRRLIEELPAWLEVALPPESSR
jgi:adenosylhomocysteine nucleosidase